MMDQESKWNILGPLKVCCVVMQELDGQFCFTGSWRGTYLSSQVNATTHLASEPPCSKRKMARSENGSVSHALSAQLNDAGSPSAILQKSSHNSARLSRGGKRKAAQPQRSAPWEAHLCISNFYSDLLYQPWHCAHVPLKASWLAGDDVPRLAHLTPANFRQQFEVPNRPVILTDVV